MWIHKQNLRQDVKHGTYFDRVADDEYIYNFTYFQPVE